MQVYKTDPEKLLSARKVAKLLDCCDETVIRLVRSGHLSGYQVHKHLFRIPYSSVLDLLQRTKIVADKNESPNVGMMLFNLKPGVKRARRSKPKRTNDLPAK